MADVCTAFWGSGIINIDGVKWDMVLIFAISVVLLRKTKWNPVFVMILAGVLKVLVALYKKNIGRMICRQSAY